MEKAIDRVGEIQRIEALHLDPGDVLVIRATQFLSQAQREWIAHRSREIFGDRKVLVLDGGLDLDVVRKTQFAVAQSATSSRPPVNVATDELPLGPDR